MYSLMYNSSEIYLLLLTLTPSTNCMWIYPKISEKKKNKVKLLCYEVAVYSGLWIIESTKEIVQALRQVLINSFLWSFILLWLCIINNITTSLSIKFLRRHDKTFNDDFLFVNMFRVTGFLRLKKGILFDVQCSTSQTTKYFKLINQISTTNFDSTINSIFLFLEISLYDILNLPFSTSCLMNLSTYLNSSKDIYSHSLLIF